LFFPRKDSEINGKKEENNKVGNKGQLKEKEEE
jgi:hypothetical protein